MSTVKIEKVRENAVIPTRGSDYAAGYDLYACLDGPVAVYPHTYAKIPTGLKMELPNQRFGAIFPRSGIATKKGLRLANCVAVIDEDYRGEWFIPIYNDSEATQFVEGGERIAQLVLLPYYPIEFIEDEPLTETERGEGGFGSTDN